MSSRLVKELSFYRKYHYDHTNVAIHVACIPMILLSAIALNSTRHVPASLVAQVFPDFPVKYVQYLNPGVAVAVGYSLFYTYLDIPFGLPTVPLLVAAAIKETDLIASDPVYWKYALWVHIASWIAQFIGHGFFEHRAPALLDNLLQALVLAPFFVVFEVAHGLGIRTHILNNVDKVVGPEVQAFHNKKKQ